MGIPQGKEARCAPRMRISCPVTIHSGSDIFQGVIRNISKNGIAVETLGTFANGVDHYFEFELPSGPKLKVRGTIRRIFHLPYTVLYGVKLLPLSIFTRWRLQAFLNKHITNERSTDEGAQ